MLYRRPKPQIVDAGKPPVMFLVALSSSGAGQSACIDRGFVAQDFRKENAHRKIVRVRGTEMSRLMGFSHAGGR